MPKYVHDENNNRIEALSKEEVYALLAAAIQQGELPQVPQDTAFVTMIKSIVDGKAYKQAFCTQAQYNDLKASDLLELDTLYYIIDDTTAADINTAITALQVGLASADTTLANLNTRLTAAENKLARTEQTITIGINGAEVELDPGIYVFYTGNYSHTFILNIRSKEYLDAFYYSTQLVQFVSSSIFATALRYEYSEGLGGWRLLVMRASLGGETSIDGGTFNFYKL